MQTSIRYDRQKNVRNFHIKRQKLHEFFETSLTCYHFVTNPLPYPLRLSLSLCYAMVGNCLTELLTTKWEGSPSCVDVDCSPRSIRYRTSWYTAERKGAAQCRYFLSN